MIRYKNRGVTLVELLVVLGLVTVLAALVLPTIKNVMIDRKGTQSASMLRNFLEAARARAVGSGRPVAVVFERISSVPLDANVDGTITFADTFVDGSVTRLKSATAIDPLPTPSTADMNFLPYNTCIRLSIAEQPLPFTSDMLSTTLAFGTTFNASPPPTIFGNDGGKDRDLFYIPSGQVSSVISAYFATGNEISFGLSHIRRMIVKTEFDGSGNLWVAVLSKNAIDPSWEEAIPSSDSLTLSPVFTIFQRPKPVSGLSMQMPKGMCVDLSISGFASTGSVAGRDRRRRFSSDWLYAGSIPPSAAELRPLYIVFAPDGTMSRVYVNGSSTLGTQAALVPDESADDFFLHIGKIDQVVVPTMPAAAIAPQNLTDIGNYVIRLSPKSGAISSAPAANVTTQAILRGVTPATVGDIVELTRQNTYGSPTTGQ